MSSVLMGCIPTKEQMNISLKNKTQQKSKLNIPRLKTYFSLYGFLSVKFSSK